MKLHDLFQGIGAKMPQENPEITGVTCSSRDVEEGSLFFAIPGFKVDGAQFAAEAEKKGAVAVVSVRPLSLSVPVIVVENIRGVLAAVACRFYPSDGVNKVAITGTNGKTSVVGYVRQLMTLMGVKTASIGTIGVTYDTPLKGIVNEVNNTTSDPVTLNKNLNALQENAVQAVAMEYTSVGLDQDRTAGLVLEGAGFTNLTQDHLDYHKTMAAYFACKLKIFESVRSGGLAVLNADIPEFEVLKDKALSCGLRIFSVGKRGDDIRLDSQTLTPRGQELTLTVAGQTRRYQLPIYGDFQAMNVLEAVGLCVALGAPLEKALGLIEKLSPPLGRLELVRCLKNGTLVFVDYAHTPDALERALQSLRGHAKGKLVCVFGCGGNRDTTKRPMMGKIAADLADKVYVTDDNPRDEDPSLIRKEILGACPKGIEIEGRAEAIERALSDSGDKDVIILAGKGHEDYQIVKGVKHHFSDKEQVLAYVD